MDEWHITSKASIDELYNKHLDTDPTLYKLSSLIGAMEFYNAHII